MHFKSVFSDCIASPDDCTLACENVTENCVDIGTFRINPEMIKLAAKKLKCSFAPGPHGIPSAVYCRCIDSIMEPLARIFNRSFEQKSFPETWKSAFMVPVLKSNDRLNVRCYRGITNLSAGSKLFEILVYNALFQSTLQYIAPEQHGFYPGRSVCTNLL